MTACNGSRGGIGASRLTGKVQGGLLLLGIALAAGGCSSSKGASSNADPVQCAVQDDVCDCRLSADIPVVFGPPLGSKVADCSASGPTTACCSGDGANECTCGNLFFWTNGDLPGDCFAGYTLSKLPYARMATSCQPSAGQHCCVDSNSGGCLCTAACSGTPLTDCTSNNYTPEMSCGTSQYVDSCARFLGEGSDTPGAGGVR